MFAHLYDNINDTKYNSTNIVTETNVLTTINRIDAPLIIEYIIDIIIPAISEGMKINAHFTATISLIFPLFAPHILKTAYSRRT